MSARPLPSEHPNLRQAAGRLRRTLWVWGALSAGMGLLSASAAGGGALIPACGWLAAALLMAAFTQPVLLALAAVQWALSLLAWIPGVGNVVGADPLAVLLQPGSLESFGLAAVRLLLAATAWNQFLFYRMLYGTGGAAGLDPGLPPIPEVVPNRSDGWSVTAGALALAALGAAGLALALSTSQRPGAIQAGLVLASLGLGLGVGAAFSPTRRRGTALLGMGAAGIAIVAALAVGTTLPR